jgi:predicted nucleotidyltransferase
MISRDYEELLESFNAHGVRYLLVGAHAVALHGRPRATKDLDIFLEATDKNAAKVLTAIRTFFGGTDLGIRAEDLLTPGKIIQLGVAPSRIDLLSRLASRIEFSQAWSNRVEAHYGSVATHFIGLDDLIVEKTASGRLQDQADLETLRRKKNRR